MNISSRLGNGEYLGCGIQSISQCAAGLKGYGLKGYGPETYSHDSTHPPMYANLVNLEVYLKVPVSWDKMVTV